MLSGRPSEVRAVVPAGIVIVALPSEEVKVADALNTPVALTIPATSTEPTPVTVVVGVVVVVGVTVTVTCVTGGVVVVVAPPPTAVVVVVVVVAAVPSENEIVFGLVRVVPLFP